MCSLFLYSNISKNNRKKSRGFSFWWATVEIFKFTKTYIPLLCDSIRRQYQKSELPLFLIAFVAFSNTSFHPNKKAIITNHHKWEKIGSNHFVVTSIVHSICYIISFCVCEARKFISLFTDSAAQFKAMEKCSLLTVHWQLHVLFVEIRFFVFGASYTHTCTEVDKGSE